jgi:Ca2+:H+ antiporter
MLRTIVRFAIAWITVVVFVSVGKAMTGQASALVSAALFAWLLAVVVWAAFGAVHEAEALAERLGEPLGTLVLTLSIVIIEVALVGAVMLDAKGVPTLGRDTMFAVLMIVLNGVVGLGLLLGGLRHQQQSFNLRGASAFLSVIVPLSVIALVLPNFTTSTSVGTLAPGQSVTFSLATIVLYGLFLWLQTGRHRGFFTAEDGKAEPAPRTGDEHGSGSALMHGGLLLANLLPIVILSKSVAALLDKGLDAAGAPAALGGVVIAAIVFTPEALTALRAVQHDQLTRAINLCLGAATSTLGLTVPAVLLIGLMTPAPVVLGLSPANMVLLATTLVLNALTFSQGRTTMLEGAVHLTLFAIFVVLIFSP